jgi:hypothetical protein
MTKYRVTWYADVDAGSAEDAARRAHRVQRSDDGRAVFTVCAHSGPQAGSDVQVDLTTIDDGRVVWGEVGVRDPVFHLTSECPEIPDDGTRPIRWGEAKSRVTQPRICAVCN